MKFRKKPVVIEATQWFKMGDHPAVGHNGSEKGIIQTLEGPMTVSPGDWIITGVKGEHYPCKPDIFEATYEAAEPAPVKAQWCYSVNEENYYGSHDTEAEAHGEAQQHLHYDMEVGDTAEYWVAKVKAAEEFLTAQWVGQSIADSMEDWLADEIGWDDRLVELSATEAIELGQMVISYIRKVDGFRAYGIAEPQKHTYTKEEE